MTTVEIGVGLSTSDPSGQHRLVADARLAEQAGLDAVSIADVLLGDGTPSLECVVAAAAVAAATERVRIEFGVLVLPTRQAAWLGAQIAALQHVSGNRIVLGVGIGGFPDSPFWRAVGAPRRGRDRVVESMLEVLPRLIAGEPTAVDGEVITLAPPAPVPVVLVGGHSEHAIRRAVSHADGWFPSLMSPATLARRVATLRDLAITEGRPVPRVHFGTHAALGPDSATQRAAMIRMLTQNLGLTDEEAESVPITGTAAQVADRMAEFAAAGADSITIPLDGPDWEAQLEVLAEARQLLLA